MTVLLAECFVIDSAPGPTTLGRELGRSPAGAALETGVPGGHLTWDCPVCGRTRIAAGAAFCGGCGLRLRSELATVAYSAPGQQAMGNVV